jgi:hypothetical protein
MNNLCDSFFLHLGRIPRLWDDNFRPDVFVHGTAPRVMSALGQRQTYAVQQVMFALPPIGSAKADSPKRSCPHLPRKRTCAVQEGMSALPPKATWNAFSPMSALGQRRTHAALHKGIVIRSPHWGCARSDDRIVTSNAFAVCKLMTRSNLIGACSTGRSSALALFNKRSTMHHEPTLELLNANRLLGTGISSGWRAGNCNYDLDCSRT